MKIFTVLFILLTLGIAAQSQDFSKMTGSQICSQVKSNYKGSLGAFELSPNTPVHSFDVLNYELKLDIYNCFSSGTRSFSASNLITFRVDSVLNSIVLNATYTSLVIDSVRLSGGVSLTYVHSQSTNKVTINLDRTYNPGEVVNIIIYYRHNNVNDYAFNVSSGYVYTDCEPEGARKWFPCWDKPSDKATFDITVKVPLSVKIGSNGRLADSTISGDSIRYHWISRDPISTYLAVLTGKANYNISIVWWHKISNPNDSIPIMLYFATGEYIQPTHNAILDMTTYYSTLFGEHPFEKNGFASVAGYGGGMENQTLTTIYPSGWTSVSGLISHEFGHQWFGDMITCGTWADIWLNEGFATYLEALYDEHISGYSSYKYDINSFADGYMTSNPGWAIYNPDWAINTPSTSILFNGAITYDKGACVLHMLRYTIGDSLFFASFKAYATDTTNFRLKNAVTNDFFDKFSAVSGQDLNWFRDEWVMQPNHPAYQNSYNVTDLGNGSWRLVFVANQVQTNTVFHKMPIVIKVSFAGNPDTSIRVMNDLNNQSFTFTFSSQPVTVAFDPNIDIVLKTATLTIGIRNISTNIPKKFAVYQNYPNPFNPVTKFNFDIPVKSYVHIKVYDITGRVVTTLVNQELQSGSYETIWDAANYSSGIYFYSVEANNFSKNMKMVLVK